jgi:hypothetical protein
MPIVYAVGFAFRSIGPLFCGALYYLIYMHFECYMFTISAILMKRLGTEFALVWTGIGLTLCYNICFNHLMAMLLKPGSPKDLVKIEELRKEVK